jgi:phosphodiesterase/alkaline phosphatase D-like protein
VALHHPPPRPPPDTRVRAKHRGSTSLHAPIPRRRVRSTWKFIDNQRGYLLCDLDRDRWLTDLRTVSTVRSPEAAVSTLVRFVTEDGVPGVHVA